METRVGMRVRIAQAEGRTMAGIPLRDPHPEHIAKLGTIIAEEELTGWGFGIPVIKLDDGTVLRGSECWWEPVE